MQGKQRRDLVHYLFSTKSDSTNKKEKVQGAYMKTFKGLTGECPKSRWATAPLNMVLGASATVLQDVTSYTLISREILAGLFLFQIPTGC